MVVAHSLSRGRGAILHSFVNRIDLGGSLMTSSSKRNGRLGVALGLAAGYLAPVRNVVEPLVEMLRPITLWRDILPIIHGHHERWDGNGYPAGLAGEDIPLGARVVAVAEVFDAMTRDTPYGPKRTPAEAIAELEAFAGSQFDPRVVRLFVAEYRQRSEQIPTS
jgi:hypothetical protein